MENRMNHGMNGRMNQSMNGGMNGGQVPQYPVYGRPTAPANRPVQAGQFAPAPRFPRFQQPQQPWQPNRNADIERQRMEAMIAFVRNNQLVYIDTNIFMMEGPNAEPFFPRLAAAGRAAGKRFLVPESVAVELNNKRDQGLPAGAAGVERFLWLQEQGLITVQKDDIMGNFADGGFLGIVGRVNRHMSVGLITHDRKMAWDLLNLQCVHAPLTIMRVDDYGFLSNWAGRFAREAQAEAEAQAQAVAAAPAPAAEPSLFRDRAGRYPRYAAPAADGRLPEYADGPMPERFHAQEGATVYNRDREPLTLGVRFGGGNEAELFQLTVNGQSGQCAKIFIRPTHYKAGKVTLLCERAFDVEGVLMPTKALHNENGVFIGYVMPYVRGVSLRTLFNPAGRRQYASDWDRLAFAQLACAVGKRYAALHARGVLHGDVSDTNIVVALDEQGRANPDAPYLIDLDSAQVGTQDCTFPASGLSPRYAAPELLQNGWKEGQLRSCESELFSVSLLLMQIVLCGVHPFRGITAESAAGSADSDSVIRENIRLGRLPYGVGKSHRDGEAPGLAGNLWSYLSRSLKETLHQAMTAEPADRPRMAKVCEELRLYVSWLKLAETRERFPQALSLCPTSRKPYWARVGCCHCGGAADLANGGKELRDQVMCAACAQESVATCTHCGGPITRGDRFLATRERTICPKCFQQARNNPDHDEYCSRCGRLFTSATGKEGVCPDCRAQAPAPAPAVVSAPATRPAMSAPAPRAAAPARKRWLGLFANR